MEKENYTIKTILDSVMKVKSGVVKKRLIFDKSFLGGIGSKWIIISFILLPFVIYAAIFNPVSFAYFGIAQAIVVYIIFLVFAMQIVAIVTYYNNKKVIKMITPSWEKYFPGIDFRQILSSGTTPYTDFKKHYQSALKDDLDENALHSRLKDAFAKMENENSYLVDAMNRDKKKQEIK